MCCLPLVELGSGCCVLTGLFLQEALLFVMLQLAAFIGVIVPNLGGKQIISDCGCSGGMLDSRVGPGLLFRDLALLAAAAALYRLPLRSGTLFPENKPTFKTRESAVEEA
jgi:hypothetical protein